jgi:hypothetical protein
MGRRRSSILPTPTTARAFAARIVFSARSTRASMSANSWQRDLGSQGSSTAEVAMQHVLAVARSTGIHPPSATADTRLTASRVNSRRDPRPLRPGR